MITTTGTSLPKKYMGIAIAILGCTMKSAITQKKKYKRTPLKEITALKYHTSAMEIADMLLEVNL